MAPDQSAVRGVEDIRDLDTARVEKERRMIPFEVTSATMDGANSIRAWRQHRSLSRGDRAQAAGIGTPQLAEIEDGT
jgi:hypothetical protein